MGEKLNASESSDPCGSPEIRSASRCCYLAAGEQQEAQGQYEKLSETFRGCDVAPEIEGGAIEDLAVLHGRVILFTGLPLMVRGAFKEEAFQKFPRLS